MVLPTRILVLFLAIVPFAAPAQTKGPLPVNPADAKNQSTGKEAPPADPALAKYGIYAESAPFPVKGEAVVTTLPLKLEKGDRIAFVGNGLLEQAGRHGILEAMLYQAHPDLDLVIRNSGPVIPEERLPQVFKPFMTTKGHNHCGLGLTIAAVLSGQMKMRLGLASGDGITTAWISAPAAI